jgi:ABC-2 type transport system permease protein
MPDWLRTLVELNPISWMATAMRGLLGDGASAAEIALADAPPVALTALLSPLTLWLYRRR